MSEIKRILITGASSALGSFIAKSLRGLNQSQKFELIGLSRTKPINNYFDKFIRCDLGNFRKIDCVFKEIENKYFDLLIHASSAVPISTENAHEFFQTNCYGSFYLVEKLRYQIKGILNISSSSVYNQNDEILLESSDIDIYNEYGLSKFYFERILKNFAKVSNIQFISLRVPVLILPGVQNNFIAKWKELAEKDEEILISNPNSFFNQVGDARVIVGLATLSLNNYSYNDTVNLGSFDTIRISNLTEIFQRHLGKKINFKIQESKKKAQLLSTTELQKIPVKLYTVEETISWYLG